MRLLAVATVLASVVSFSLFGPSAEAQKFPPYVKDCKKAKDFERVEREHVVPSVDGGAGKVVIVSQNYDCQNKSTRNGEWISLRGMKNAGGKLVVPYAYESVLPISTTGAVVGPYGDRPFRGAGGYYVHQGGKLGKERFSFHPAVVEPDNGCPPAPGDASLGRVSSVIAEDVFNRGGKTQVTLFRPDGAVRVMDSMGGNDMKRPVRRVGDVLLARWIDDWNMPRSGILDLYGRPIAPVLSNATTWMTPIDNPARTSVEDCGSGSLDLFIEGPSLDFDSATPFFGPALILVDRDGQPVPMPKGAIGMFPVYPRNNDSRYSDAVRNMTSMWAVAFPTREGFEFTLHLGAPSEALVAAETAPRFTTMARRHVFGGLVAAQRAADRKWVTFRANTNQQIGDIDADYDRSMNSATALLEAESAQRDREVAAQIAKDQAERIEARKRDWQAARSTGRLCQLRADANNTRAELEDYLAACGPDNYPGFTQLALSRGVPQSALDEAANAQALKMMEVYKARAKWEEERRLRDMRNANKDPMASYMPGQWESAIRNAGNAAVDAINESSDNWLQQRRDQYIADWQRSQRAY